MEKQIWKSKYNNSKFANMTQKEKLEILTGEKMPEPTEQDQQRIQIEGTPFWHVGSNEKGWNLILGKYKLNQEPLPTRDQLIEWTNKQQHWNTTLSLIICVVTDMLNNQVTDILNNQNKQ